MADQPWKQNFNTAKKPAEQEEKKHKRKGKLRFKKSKTAKKRMRYEPSDHDYED